MSSVFDYIHWRSDISFDISPFNNVDNIVFCLTSYLNLGKGCSKFPSGKKTLLHDNLHTMFKATKKEDMILGLILPKTIVELVDNIKDTLRYGSEVYTSNYIDVIDTKRICQFSAICFHLPNDIIYVTFRGTDDNVVGWQEDIDMIKKFPVPSQSYALKYLNKIAQLYPKEKLIVGGHSKGGNLAVYASIYAPQEVKDRIIKVYNNDGPGFLEEYIDIKSFLQIKDKIVRIIPKNSIVGLTLKDFSGNTIVVDSKARGLLQHDALQWEVDKLDFKLSTLNQNSVKFSDSTREMIRKMSDDERHEVIQNIFDFLSDVNSDTLLEIQKDFVKILKYSHKINSKSRKVFLEIAYYFIKFRQI